MKLPEEEFEFHVARLELAPGDALVARVDRIISADASARLRLAIESALPKTKVLVISPGTDLTVVSKVEAKKMESGK